MAFTRKVLWIVKMNSTPAEQALAAHAQAAGIDTVCIRTDSTLLPGAIGRFHQAGVKVWAWRWPGVIPSATGTYYALRQAEYVRDILIPAGLDGYIVDPESDKSGPNDHAHDGNDWNQTQLAPIAQQFCQIIETAAQGTPFVFGTTSGCTFPAPTGKPNIPWTEFFTASDALYPQCYWRAMLQNNAGVEVPTDIHGGTPASAIARGIAAWQPKSLGKPIIPMAGEIDLVTAAEIAQYGALLTASNVSEAHFYADSPNVSASVLTAINAL